MSKVLVVLLENHDYETAMSEMPALAGAGRRYGLFTNYFGVAHPSLPNYLAIAGGSTSGVDDDQPPAANPVSGMSVFGQALAAGGSARTYAEGMQKNCQLQDGGRYAVRHNPWTYFVDERQSCGTDDVPMGTTTGGALASDIAAGNLPTIGMMIPDTCNDAHDCPLSHADARLKDWLTAVTSGPDFSSGRLGVFVTFDEDNRQHANHVTAVMLQKDLRGGLAEQSLNHVNLSAALSTLAAGRPLRGATTEHDVFAAIGLATPASAG